MSGARDDEITLDALRAKLATGLAKAVLAKHVRDDHHRRERNRTAARRAYDSVIQAMSKATLSRDDTAEVTSHLRQLRAAIAAIPHQ